VSEHGRILILWNQVEDDVYERWRAEGRTSVDWDPNRVVHDVGTVAEDMQQIVTALKDAGHEVSLVNIRDDFATLVAAIQHDRPDAILNLIEFFGDDASHEAHVAGVLELMGVAYTGARPFALTLCQRKHRAKAMLREAGLPTSPYFVVSGRIGDDHAPQSHGLRFPLIVKPAFEDASGGIELTSVVRDQAALEERVDYTLEEYAMPVLVEEYIDGREIHCAVIGNDPPEPLPLFEMEFTERLGSDGKPLPKIITFRAKWDPYHRDFYAMDGRCPAEGLDPDVEAHIKDVAIRAYRALGCRDYARVDMRLDAATGQPYILEVNPNPDLADGGAFIQCATASGRTFAATINQIIGFALTRARAHAEDSVSHEERGENGPRGASDQLLSEDMNRNKPGT
jgi:D-alanine-D-alanine ligase